MTETIAESPSGVLPDRSCGSCNLCCKVFAFPELSKPAGAWCRHVATGKGCTIYSDRPDFCRSFFCMWRYNAALGPEWKPDRARFVLSTYPGGKGMVLAVTLDPGAPTAWRKEPYYGQIKEWAKAALLENSQVMVVNGNRVIVPLPGSDVDVGVLNPGDRIDIVQQNGAYSVEVVRAKVPAA
jgi:hypothetical protein